MDLSAIEIVLRIFAGILIGFSVGLTGVGGGILGMPILTVGFGLSATAAIGTNSFYLFLANIFASYKHHRLGNICWKAVWLLMLSAAPANALVSWMINHELASRTVVEQKAFQGQLKMVIAVVMTLTVGALIADYIRSGRRLAAARAAALEQDTAAAATADGDASAPPPIATTFVLAPMTGGRLAGALALGAMLGAITGATTMSGAVVSPILMIFFALPASLTVGSTVVVALLSVSVTFLMYGASGQIHYGTALVMFVGSLVGVTFGSSMTKRLPERKLKAVIIGLIAVSTFLMFAKGLKAAKSPGEAAAAATSATAADAAPTLARPAAGTVPQTP